MSKQDDTRRQLGAELAGAHRERTEPSLNDRLFAQMQQAAEWRNQEERARHEREQAEREAKGVRVLTQAEQAKQFRTRQNWGRAESISSTVDRIAPGIEAIIENIRAIDSQERTEPDVVSPKTKAVRDSALEWLTRVAGALAPPEPEPTASPTIKRGKRRRGTDPAA